MPSTNMFGSIKEGSYKVVFDDGSEYDGEVENGKRHGTGKFTYTNGNVYDGCWKEDECHGKGKLVFTNGYVYEGEFKDGKRDGQGKFTWSNGDVYEGEWKNGKHHGTGKYTWSNGNVYEGEWKNGKYHGTGKYTSSSGEVYEGDWKDKKRHGTGKLTCCNGAAYEGQWKDNKFHGTGKYTYRSGNVYEGQRKEHIKHGTGTFTYADGRTYTGEWADDKRHGSGTFTAANGEKYKRVYINDQQVATLVNGPSSQRALAAGQTGAVVILNDEHTECKICFTAFSTDISTADDDAQKHLPVLSTCDHVYCHGCVLTQQLALAGQNRGIVPEKIPCMKCRAADAFCPSQPKYDKRLVELLEQSIPVIESIPNELVCMYGVPVYRPLVGQTRANKASRLRTATTLALLAVLIWDSRQLAFVWGLGKEAFLFWVTRLMTTHPALALYIRQLANWCIRQLEHSLEMSKGD